MSRLCFAIPNYKIFLYQGFIKMTKSSSFESIAKRLRLFKLNPTTTKLSSVPLSLSRQTTTELVYDWPISACMANVNSLLIGELATWTRFSEKGINTPKTKDSGPLVRRKQAIYTFFFTKNGYVNQKQIKILIKGLHSFLFLLQLWS